jgi:hypothetical protein
MGPLEGNLEDRRNMTDSDAFGTEGRPVGVADGEAGHGRRAGDVAAPRRSPEGAGSGAGGPDPGASVRPRPRRWVPLLVADLVILAVGFVALIVIGVQRFGDADLASRRVAWYEDLVVFFGMGALFAAIAFVLFRSRIFRLAAVQAVLAVALIGTGAVSSATGSPKPAVVNPDDVPVPSESPSYIGPS